MGDEKKKKVIKPEDEKKRIEDMAKKERMKKILTEDMKTFGPREVSKPMKSGVVPEPKPKPMSGNMLKEADNPGLKKLPTEVRNNMGYKKKGGEVKQMKKGGKVSSFSKRADGIAVRGKTKGRMV